MSKATITLIDTDDGALEIDFYFNETEEDSRAVNIAKSMMQFLLNNAKEIKDEEPGKINLKNIYDRENKNY